MPLQNTGPISMSEIRTEFSTRLPEAARPSGTAIASSQFLASIGDVLGKTTGQAVSFSDFYGLSNYQIILPTNSFEVYTTYTATIPIADILNGAVDEYSNNQDPLTIISVSNAVNGTVVLSGSNIEFTSTGGVGIAASFTYTARNSSNITKQGTVTMNVVAIPPIIAVSDTYDLRQAETLLLSSSDLVSNDIDGQGLSLSVSSVQNPTNGTLSLNGTTIEFVSTGLSGQPAGFQYTVTNGTETQTGNVYINITPLPEQESYIYRDSGDAIAATQTLVPPTQQDIFNSWDRFDGSNYYPGGTTPGGQAADWYYNTTTESFVQPTNTSLGGGFISPTTHSDFTFEGTVYSIATNDNDTIGLIAAFARDGTTNKALVAARTKAGQQPTGHWGVFYTENGPWTPQYVIANISFTTGSTSANTWYPDQARIKVQRQGDIFKFYTTHWNDLENYQIASEITVDLNSDSRLAVFKGEAPYGYYSHSQGGSTYADINFTGGLDANILIDAQTGIVYEWNGSSWVDSGRTIQDEIGYTRKVTNPANGQRFIVKETEIVYLGTSVGATFNATRILNEEQNIIINSVNGGTGAGNSVQVVGLFQSGIEETNLLNGLPTLNTTSAYSSNTNNVGSGTYFSDNGLDISTLSLVGGVVAFANGTIGQITGITDSSISYSPTTDYTIYDEVI